jgi:hypothetical protein
MTVTHSTAMPRLKDEGDLVSAPGAYLCKRVVCAGYAKGPNQSATMVVQRFGWTRQLQCLGQDECVDG